MKQVYRCHLKLHSNVAFHGLFNRRGAFLETFNDRRNRRPWRLWFGGLGNGWLRFGSNTAHSVRLDLCEATRLFESLLRNIACLWGHYLRRGFLLYLNVVTLLADVNWRVIQRFFWTVFANGSRSPIWCYHAACFVLLAVSSAISFLSTFLVFTRLLTTYGTHFLSILKNSWLKSILYSSK